MAKVVVIDHLAETARRSGRYLREEGYDVATATSVASAVEMLALQRPELVLLDLAMPGGEALEVCHRLKSDPSTSSIALVLVEAGLPSDGVRQGMAAGADDYLIEPSSKEILLARVRSVLRTRTDRDTIGRMNQHLGARITAHRTAEAAAAAMEHYLRLLVDITGTHLDVLDADLNLRYVDPQWRSALGDYHGKKCDEYFPGRYTRREQSPAAEALLTRQTVVTEQVPPGETGPPWRVTSIPYQNEQGEWLVAEIHVAPGDLGGSGLSDRSDRRD